MKRVLHRWWNVGGVQVLWYKIGFNRIQLTKLLEHIRYVRTWRSFEEGLGASQRELHTKDEMSEGCSSWVLWYKICFYRRILHLLANEYKWVISIGFPRNFLKIWRFNTLWVNINVQLVFLFFSSLIAWFKIEN